MLARETGIQNIRARYVCEELGKRQTFRVYEVERVNGRLGTA